jgi:hypothetical protein
MTFCRYTVSQPVSWIGSWLLGEEVCLEVGVESLVSKLKQGIASPILIFFVVVKLA